MFLLITLIIIFLSLLSIISIIVAVEHKAEPWTRPSRATKVENRNSKRCKKKKKHTQKNITINKKVKLTKVYNETIEKKQQQLQQ